MPLMPLPTLLLGVALGAPVPRGLPAPCDTLAEWLGPVCQAYCAYPDAVPTPWCDTECDSSDEVGSAHCQAWCGTPAFAAILPYCDGDGAGSVQLERHELGPQYLDVGGRALDGSPALFHYRAPPDGMVSTKWVIFMEGGGACATNAECWSRAKTDKGGSANGKNTAPTMGVNSAGLFGEDAATNPGFWDAHKVYVPYLSGDLHLGNRTAAFTFPDDPDWGTLPGQDGAQPEFFFSGHLNVVHIVAELTTNATFSTAGGGIGQATDVLLTGCSAGGYGARGNADWLRDTLPATVNFRVAPIASLNLGSQTFMNFKAGVPGGLPVPLPAHVPPAASAWQAYIHPGCIERSLLAGRTDEEAVEFCTSNEGMVSSMQTPALWISPQFDTHPLTHQYGNESDLVTGDYETVEGQQYLEQWGRESRRFLFDHAEFVFAPSCLDHCGVSLLKGNAGPSIDGHSSLDVLNDWFFGHNLLSHKVIEGMGPDGVDQQPNDGLPFNPTCLNLVGSSLLGGGGDDDVDGDDSANDCSDACAGRFAQCFDRQEGGGASAAQAFDQCRRGIDQQHRHFAASCEAGCVATDAMLAVLG